MNLVSISPSPIAARPLTEAESASRWGSLAPLEPATVASRNAVVPIASGAVLADLVALLDPARVQQVASAAVQEPLRLWRVRGGATLVQEGATAPWLYVIHCGSFKTLRTAEDGYQQVLSMLLPGDMMGFEVLCCEHQPAAAVALEDATVYAFTVNELALLEQRHPAFDRAVQRALTRQLVRAAEMAEVMSPVSAEARVARFVLWLSARMAARGESPQRLRLRLCRRDMASLLGLAHETVSRAFTTLAGSGCLKVNKRDIWIADRVQLKARARHTRGPLDEPPSLPTSRPSMAAGVARASVAA